MSDYPTPFDTSGALQPPSPSGGLPQSSPGLPDYYVPPGADGHYHPVDPDVPANLFGQPIPGATGRQLEEHVLHPLASAFMGEMLNQRIPYKYVDAAANWLLSSALGPQKYEPPAHTYDTSGFLITEADVAPLNLFLNEMNRVNADNHSVRLMMSWWWQQAPKILQNLAARNQQPAHPDTYSLIDELTDSEFRAVEKRSASDRDAAESQLRNLWGDRYQSNIDAVHRYVSRLPPQDKLFFETAVAKGGQLLANDAGVIQHLYEQATGISAPSKDVEAEIASIEKYMKENSAAYFRDDKMQARLRFLYEARG